MNIAISMHLKNFNFNFKTFFYAKKVFNFWEKFLFLSKLQKNTFKLFNFLKKMEIRKWGTIMQIISSLVSYFDTQPWWLGGRVLAS